ncbi:MAG: hypothetical protein K5695_06030 [Oscillospiraceae bacterium]|nr:hypothetical protein [Oscillospiraceae bacterium]
MGTSKNYVFRGGVWGRAPHLSHFAFRRKAKWEFLEMPKCKMFEKTLAISAKNEYNNIDCPAQAGHPIFLNRKEEKLC